MKKNENGFSIVEVLVVLVIVGLIGAAGWYVWQAKNNKATPPVKTNSQDQSTQKTEQTIDFKVPDGWVENKYTRTGISFWTPNDWKTRELEKVNQISIDAPNTVTVKTVGGENETFRFHINIASPSASSVDEVGETPNIFSSSAITTNKLLKGTYLTLDSGVDSFSPGVDSFIVTHAKYSTRDKSYKPALQINATTYEIWGGIYYDNDYDSGEQPRLSLEQFNKLKDFVISQDILKSIKSLK